MGVANVVSVVIWNVAFAGSTTSTTRGAAPTEKMVTGATRLDPQNAWNERMTNQYAVQEKEIAELKSWSFNSMNLCLGKTLRRKEQWRQRLVFKTRYLLQLNYTQSARAWRSDE